MLLAPGTVLQDRYVVERSVTSGGMGEVYRAHDRRLDRTVAVKRMVPPPGLDAMTCASLNVQFTEEAQTLARLRHRNVVGVSDCFDQAGDLYLVMEYVKGRSLEAYIEEQGKLPEGQVLAWTAQLLDALSHCHANGVIHRDIKPSNVLIDGEGQAVLIDFGIAKLQDTGDARTRTAIRDMGTPEYCPLEQYDAKVGNDARSDLYSLGATLYHALSGEPPAIATTRILDPAALKPLRVLSPELSQQTEQAIHRALELHPEDRFQSAREMAEALLKVLRQPAPPPAQVPTRPVPAPTAPPLAVSAPVTAASPSSTSPPEPRTLRPHTAAPATVAGQPPATAATSPPAAAQAATPRAATSRAARPRPTTVLPAERKPRRWAWIVGAVLALLIVGGLLTVYGLRVGEQRKQEEQYAAAIADLDAGRWEEARDKLSALGDYKEAAELIEESYVRQAEQALEEQYDAAIADLDAGRWLEARDKLLALGDYREAVRLIKESYIGQAVQALEGQRWLEARELMAEIPDHPDAKRILVESYYRPTLQAVEEGQWDRAADEIVQLNLLVPYYGELGHMSLDIPELRKELRARYTEFWRTRKVVPLATLSGHEDAVRSVLFALGGRLFSGSSDGTLRMWSVPDMQSIDVFRQGEGPVLHMAVSPDRRRLVTGSANGLLHLREAPEWPLVATLEGHTAEITGLAFTREGQHLASAAGNGVVRLWYLSAHPALMDIERGPHPALGVGFLHDERLIVLGKGAGGTWIGGPERVVPDENPVDFTAECAVVQPYGELLAVGTSTSLVHLWQVEGREVWHWQDLEGQTGSVQAIAFSPNSELLAAGSSSGMVRIWGIPDGETVQFWHTDQGPLRALAFSPTGALLATASDDHTIKLWTVRP